MGEDHDQPSTTSADRRDTRRLLRRYAPDIAEKPARDFTVADGHRFLDILNYMRQRSAELSEAMDALIQAKEQHGEHSIEADRIAKEIEVELPRPRARRYRSASRLR
jgi:hypothetical protein